MLKLFAVVVKVDLELRSILWLAVCSREAGEQARIGTEVWGAMVELAVVVEHHQVAGAELLNGSANFDIGIAQQLEIAYGRTIGTVTDDTEPAPGIRCFRTAKIEEAGSVLDSHDVVDVRRNTGVVRWTQLSVVESRTGRHAGSSWQSEQNRHRRQHGREEESRDTHLTHHWTFFLL